MVNMTFYDNETDLNYTFDDLQSINITYDTSFSLWKTSALWLLEAVALAFLIVLTVAGNLLVIVGVACSPRLRSPTYSFIVNLAVADLLIGLVVLPISAARELFDYQLNPIVCAAWSSLDVLCCTASILSLCALAAERHAGVARPLRVRSAARARRRLFALWAASAAIALAGLRAQPPEQPCALNKHLGYVIFSACGSFYLPALVMLALWWRVYRAAARRSAHLARGHLVGAVPGDLALRAHRGGANNCNMMQSQIAVTAEENVSSSRRSSEWSQPHAPHHKTITIVTRSRQLRSCSTPGPDRNFRNPTNVSCTIHNHNGNNKNSNSANEHHFFRNFSARSLQSKQVNRFESGQNRAVRTLALVVGGFLLCWCPFFIFLPIEAACSTCNVGKALSFSFWLGYFNSCINPFIYACSSREMRRAFRTILCRRQKRPILDCR